MIPFAKYYSILKRYLLPHRLKLGILSFLLLIDIALRIINPQIISYYIDEVTSGPLTNRIISAAIIYIGLAVIQQLIFVTTVYATQDVAWSATNDLRVHLFKHCVNLDMTFHNEYKPGELIERIDGDVTSLANFFSTFIIQVAGNLLLIVGILAVLFFEGLLIGLGFTGFTIIAFLIMAKVRNIAIPYWKTARQKAQELYGFLEERISGMEDIRSIGAQEYVRSRYHNVAREEYRSFFKAVTISRIITMAMFGIQGLGITMVFVIAYPLYDQRVLSIGDVFLLNYYMTLLFEPIFQLLRQIQDLQQADASIDRISKILEEETVLEDTGTKRISDQEITIGFNKLSFAYKENEYVLRDIDFQLDQKKSVGLIGRTGSGKTTITRLIFRLYDIKDGEITFNGTNIKEFPIKELREQVAIVTQNVELFEATLRDNIRFFDSSIPDEKILRAIDEVGLNPWFQKLPEGLETIIKSENTVLSAGEAQLLAFTRVFLKDPKIVILDEASSRLDPVTEQLIQKAIDKLIMDKTAIIIAHRLDTLRKVDNIMLIDQGSIVEFGAREKLQADPNSNYSKLLKTGLEEVLA